MIILKYILKGIAWFAIGFTGLFVIDVVIMLLIELGRYICNRKKYK